ncbi:MAG: hypothetical protein OWV35_01965 [Firmicutes bacterium]|nr:hypothetical protein [Bacillota bacterium]
MGESRDLVQWQAADTAAWRLPPVVAAALQRLRQAGEMAYVVGGAVRDLYWGRTPEDWDLVTSAPPDRVLALFPGAVAPGLRFGTVRIPGGVEVTTMREEGDYADRRRPGRVRFTRVLGRDLARRDFTLNAVVWDGASRLGGPPGALEDLAARRLRAVGDPRRRFREDALRVLRLARLAGVYNLTIDAATFEAAWAERTGLLAVSRERRLAEAGRLAQGPARGWRLLGALGLAFALEWPGRWPRALAPDGAGPGLALFLLARAYGLEGGAGAAWAARWPLPRAWRRAWVAAFSGPDPWQTDAGTLACRCRAGGPDAGLWREWAVLQGWARAGDPAWEPVTPALDGRTVATLTGLEGPELGRVLAAMRRWVVCHPADNRPEVLAAGLRPGCGWCPPERE